MQEISNSPVDGVGATTTEVGTQTETVVEAGQAEKKYVPEEDYTNLQSFATKARQNEIELAKKLVEKDKSEINSIKDAGVRDKVVKELFGYTTYEEMVAVEGKDFASPDEQDNDELTTLRKTVNKLTYRQTVREVDEAIENYKASNPEMFRSESAEKELREKMQLISPTIDVKERVRMAGTLAFSQATMNPTVAAYKALSIATVNGSGASSASVDEKPKDESSKKTESIMDFLKLAK